MAKLWLYVRNFLRRLGGLGPAPPLCDSCRWDYGNACKRPERPNAMICSDYAKRS